MKRRFLSLPVAALVATACQMNPTVDQIISQTYVHKYGFETSESDWEAREQDGQVVSKLKNGVVLTQSFENGKLHGPTTYSFPKSTVVEKQQLYDEGILLKEQINDIAGMPVREEVYEFGDRIIITLWDDKGVPLSIEEYDDDLLMEAKYYTSEHELEANVSLGNGGRVKRDRSGLLISRDEIANGIMTAHTTYHPNGNIHTISHYDNYQLHGKQMKFSVSGKPLMEMSWNHNEMDGTKTVYRNGKKIVEIPYVNGKRHGTELHFDDLGYMTAEIEWQNDQRHGPSSLHSEESSDTEWFYKGQSVRADRYRMLEQRGLIQSEFQENPVR